MRTVCVSLSNKIERNNFSFQDPSIRIDVVLLITQNAGIFNFDFVSILKEKLRPGRPASFPSPWSPSSPWPPLLFASLSRVQPNPLNLPVYKSSTSTHETTKSGLRPSVQHPSVLGRLRKCRRLLRARKAPLCLPLGELPMERSSGRGTLLLCTQTGRG